MGYLLDAVRALRTALRTAFRPPTTVEYPDVIRPRAERYRASFALPDDENGEIACIACLACERICPSQVIKMKSGGKRESPVTGKKRAYVDEFVLDLSACIQCELCVQVCNSDAIYMIREPEVPGYCREDLVLDITRLRANAHDKTAAWGRGTVLQEMQEPPKVEKAPAKAAVAAKPAAEGAPPAEAKAPAVATPPTEAKAPPVATPPAETTPAAKPAPAEAAASDAKAAPPADPPLPVAAAVDKETA